MIDIQLRGVTERDVDLLLLEEFVSDPTFCGWFLGKIGLAETLPLTAAARSVTTSTGESDLELTFGEGERLTKVLVENKVDAPLQPRQAERYAQRAAAYRASGFDPVVTVLIAPLAYTRKAGGFDRRLTYGAVRRFLRGHLRDDARGRYKHILLCRAVERGLEGWVSKPDALATAFWRRYWEIATELAPELNMPEPGPKPATSNFVRFDPMRLARRGAQLFHKVPYGHVDLQFPGKASTAADFEAAHRGHLEAGMRIEMANKSLVVRMTVPQTHVRASLPQAEQVIRHGVAAARRLLQWHSRWL
jgi:hypothetical protein